MSKPKKTVIAVVTTLAVLVVALLWVFVRHGLRIAAADPEKAEKLARLRQFLPLRRH